MDLEQLQKVIQKEAVKHAEKDVYITDTIALGISVRLGSTNTFQCTGLQLNRFLKQFNLKPKDFIRIINVK